MTNFGQVVHICIINMMTFIKLKFVQDQCLNIVKDPHYGKFGSVGKSFKSD